MMPVPKQTQIRRDRPLCHRMMLMTCLVTLGFSIVVWRLYDLHLKRGPQFAEKAAEKFREIRTLPAQRGSIKDHGGRYLAYDEEIYELSTNRVHLYELPTIKPSLAKARGVKLRDMTRTMSDEEIIKAYHTHLAQKISVKLSLPEAEVLSKISSKEQIEVLAQKMNEKEAESWRQYLRENFIKGVYIKSSVRRHYPTENRLALIIGGVEGGKGGVLGVEKTQEDILHGIDGRMEVEHDKYGREMLMYRGDIVHPVHGRDVHLTIDLPMQDAIDKIVDKADQFWKPSKIMAIVTEVGTGSVLAMSFRPSHDRAKPADTSWKNLTIYEPYEPGSTFKVVAFTAALDQRKITAETRIDCEMGKFIDPVLKTKLTDLKTLGMAPAHDVLKYSSNIGTYKIFKKVGQETYLDYVKRFGFGRRTDIALNGESTGYINDKQWSNTTSSRFPIGYEVNVTPIQMAMAYGALANGGILMRPRLVDRVVSEGGRKVEIVPPEVVGQVCTGKTSATMRDLLAEVVAEGTGSRAQLEGIEVAGKTGTSRRYDPSYVYRDDRGKLKKGGYPPNQWITSFAGFAPAKDPKIVCVVVLDYPKSADPQAIGGGKVAAPIFAEIVAETLKQLSVRPQRPLALQGTKP
jgi:cell division protein FtsI/penicillin-binding protein 2